MWALRWRKNSVTYNLQPFLRSHEEVHTRVLSGLCLLGALMRSQLKDFKPQNLNSTASFASVPTVMLTVNPTLTPNH